MRSLLRHFPAVCLLAAAVTAAATPVDIANSQAKVRTVVTTDMEQDDLASLIRFLLYTPDVDLQGIIYSASRWHWAGDGNGTLFFHPDREYTTPQTSWRWTGNTTIQDIVLPAYGQVLPNLRVHDPSYPSEAHLQAMTKIGNIDFEGEMSVDTDGSNLIKSLLLDHDSRQVYLQVWGGVNTVGRALKSIEEQYCNTSQWGSIKQKISRKAVIMASGFQDDVYADYVAPNWPDIRVEDLSQGYDTWAYNCGPNSNRGDPDSHYYFTGDFIRPNIEVGPYGSIYRSWLDGQHMPGDPSDGFGNLTLALMVDKFCPPLNAYDFLSEGDNVAYNPLLNTGIQAPANPSLGGWGGRSFQNSTSPNLWQMVTTELAQNGSGVEITDYTTVRWATAIQNDFAARIQWTMTSSYNKGNHPPLVSIDNGAVVKAPAGTTVRLTSCVSDPDGDKVTTSWWQFFEEGTYPGVVPITSRNGNAFVTIPANAVAGQTISIILQGTDDGDFPLTRYARVMIHVQKGGYGSKA